MPLMPTSRRTLATRRFPILAAVLSCCQLSVVAPALAAGQETSREEASAAAGAENREEAKDRWSLALGAGLLSLDAPSGTFSFDHEVFGFEKGEFDADYAGGEAPLYELSLAVRLRGRLGLGLAWSRSSLSDAVDLVGRLPHPFLFESHRTLEGEAGGVSRDGTALHLSLRWLLLDSSKVQVALLGGPSQVDLDYDLVTAVRFSHTYPFDTAAYAGVERRRESGSATGYHVGVDVVRYLSRRTGVGGVIRYSDVSIDLDAPGGGTVLVDGGGLQAVVDLRVRF